MCRFFPVIMVLSLLMVQEVFAQIKSCQKDEWYLTSHDGNVKLYVTEFGQGNTLIILHGGWGAEHSYLLEAFEAFEDRYHLVFYDQRGSLRSPAPDSLISVTKHIEDLERLRSELRLEKMNLIGHSTGGFLAMSYLEMNPGRVKGLILISPIQTKYPITTVQERAITKEGEPAIRAFFQRPEIGAILKAEGLDKEKLTDKERSHVQKIRFAAANIYHLDRWCQLKGGGIFFNQEANKAAKNTMPDSWNFIDNLSNHQYPVSILLGDHDIVDSFGKLHRFWFNNVANVEVMVIENAGHNAWIDQPEMFRKFLEKALGKYE